MSTSTPRSASAGSQALLARPRGGRAISSTSRSSPFRRAASSPIRARPISSTQAIGAGADLVGGLDPAGIDNDVNGHLDAIFGIAERHGVGLDIHLHDPGPLGCFELRQIAGRTARDSASAAGSRSATPSRSATVDDDEFGRTAEALAKAGVAIMTNGPGPVPMPPVKRLIAAGVTVFAGSDNIRDAWSPYGNGDMLERAMLIGYRQGFLADADLEARLRPRQRRRGRRSSSSPEHGVKVGAAADLVAMRATSIAEAVAAHPPRRLVMKRGRVVARDGRPTAQWRCDRPLGVGANGRSSPMGEARRLAEQLDSTLPAGEGRPPSKALRRPIAPPAAIA